MLCERNQTQNTIYYMIPFYMKCLDKTTLCGEQISCFLWLGLEHWNEKQWQMGPGEYLGGGIKRSKTGP